MVAMEPAISEEERRKKSVYYDSCTSQFKDDFPTLVACLRSDKGDPHTRQEAGFLLWHHALEGDDVTGLLGAGLLAACVANLDTPPAGILPAERACSAGILLSLAQGNEEVSEQLVRCRAPSGRPCLEVLHSHLKEDAPMTRTHCCRLLHLLAKQIPQVMLKSMEQQLPYMSSYLSVWGSRDQKDAPVVAAVSGMVVALLQERPELVNMVVEAGGVEALLDVLRIHKSEPACCGALTLLLRLMAVEAAQGELISQGGIPLLLDLVGPPPQVAAAPVSAPPYEDDDEPVSPPSLSPRRGAGTTAGAAAGAAAGVAEGCPPPSDRAAGDGSEGGGSGGGGGSPRSSEGDGCSPSNRGTATGDGASPRSSTTAESSPAASSGAVGAVASPRGVKVPGNGASAAAGGGASKPSPVKASAGGSSPALSPKASRVRLAGTSGLLASGSSSMRVQLPLTIPGIHHGGGHSPGGALSGASSQRSMASGLLGEPSTVSLGTLSAAASAAAAAALADADVPLLPPPGPPPADLATNRCGLRWIMLPGLEVASLAVACLTTMVQRPECLAEAEYRLATHRILAHVRAAMAAAAAGSGAAAKKSRKKGVGLTAEQTTGLTRLLGLLKFLSLMNTTRYRIAKLGAIPSLVRLYGEGTDYLLRNHSQAILSNVTLLAENGQALKEGKTPEEFLVSNPMRLTPLEQAVLRLEFPDDPALGG